MMVGPMVVVRPWTPVVVVWPRTPVVGLRVVMVMVRHVVGHVCSVGGILGLVVLVLSFSLHHPSTHTQCD